MVIKISKANGKEIDVNKFYQADCMAVMSQMQKDSAHLTLTDIPYNEVNRGSNGLRSFDKGAADVMTFDLTEFLSEVYRVTSGTIIIFCGQLQVSEIMEFFKGKNCTHRMKGKDSKDCKDCRHCKGCKDGKMGKDCESCEDYKDCKNEKKGKDCKKSKKGTSRQLIWQKSNPLPSNGKHIYLSGIENAIWFKKPGAAFTAKCKNTVFRYPCGKSKLHNTEKPLGFVINDEVAHYVRRIFKDYADGISAREIACKLTRDEVDCPSYYYYKKTGKNKPRDGSVNAWTAETVQKMFNRQVYIGHMVSGTREIASIRTKERRIIDEEDWIIVQNTHDPIIEQALWDTAQMMLPCEGVSKAPRVRTLKETGDVSLFAGVLRCGVCGSKLAYIPSKRSYRCSRYNNKGKEVCVGPFISEVAVCNFVMNDIRQYATLTDTERKSLSQRLTSYFHKEQEVDANAIRSKIKAAEARLAGVPSELRSLNKDKIDGVLPAEAVALMMEDVLKEKAAIESNLPTLRGELDRILQTTGEIDEWLKRVKGCTYIEALDRATVLGLIDKIVVGERVKDPDTKKVTQTLEISYRFIGSLLNGKEDAAS